MSSTAIPIEVKKYWTEQIRKIVDYLEKNPEEWIGIAGWFTGTKKLHRVEISFKPTDKLDIKIA